MNALTKFQVGDVVRPMYTTQGLLMVKYAVVHVEEFTTPFGVFVTYVVRELNNPRAEPMAVNNGHIVLRKVEA